MGDYDDLQPQRYEERVNGELRTAIAERDRLRADFLRIADAVGLVSTDDTGRIGDVGTVDEVLAAIQRAVGESHAAVDSQLAYEEASSERDRLRRELEALRDDLRGDHRSAEQHAIDAAHGPMSAAYSRHAGRSDTLRGVVARIDRILTGEGER